MKCPCAFRLCRLAQNDVPGGVRGHLSCKFQHKMARSCTEILPRDLLQRSCQEVTYINLARKTLLESLYRRKGSCTETLHRVEILHRHLLRSCQDAPCRDLAKRPRPLIELLYRDFVRTPLLETLYGDIAWRAVAEILPRGLLHTFCQRAFIESSYGDLVKRSCREISYRYLGHRSCQETSSRDLCRESSYGDLVRRSCQETSCGDLFQRSRAERRGLARRSFKDSLNRDLTLRSITKIFCGDLL